MTETLTLWLIGGGVSAAIAAFIRFCPKQKMMDLIPEEKLKKSFGALMYGLGKTVSFFGNSKIGKKAMDKVEEGVIHTLIAVVMSWTCKLYNVGMHGLVEFGRGLVSDNSEK
jgi:hypothetical protein